MFNPLDLLQGPGGAGMQAMGQQFGLDPDQTRRALEALMPAFALGLQRASTDPTGLGHLFGSPVLTQAVLQQASATSGIGSQVLRQMLPAMAGAVVASVVHMVLNQPAPAPAAAPTPGANPFPAAAAWTEMMQTFLPAAEPNPRPAARQAPPQPAPLPGDAGRGEGGLGETGRDMLQQMLRTGAEVQEQNVRAMQGLFDAFWAAPQAPPAGNTPPAPEAGPKPEPHGGRGRRGRNASDR